MKKNAKENTKESGTSSAFSDRAGDCSRRYVYGRRQGRGLSKTQSRLYQALWPQLSLEYADLRRLPSLPVRPQTEIRDTAQRQKTPPRFQCEIGFGAGEHLAALAQKHHQVTFIGAEVFKNGIARLLARINADALDNIRLYCGDGRDVLERVPSGLFERVWILFPDPWPKKRHHRRRLIQKDTLSLLARSLKPGGEVIIATDHEEYMVWILRHFINDERFLWPAKKPEDWQGQNWRGENEQGQNQDRPATRFEQKARTQQMPCWYFRFQRTAEV